MGSKRSKKRKNTNAPTRLKIGRLDTRKRKNPDQIIHFPVPQEPIDEERFFVIEKLLDKRCSKGSEEFLVRWKNYPPEYDSWEPRHEIEKNSHHLIQIFNGELANEDQRLYCICKRKYRLDQGGMIQCFTCSNWYHFDCLAMNMEEVNSYAKYHCNDCRSIDSSLENIIKPGKLTTSYGLSLIMEDTFRPNLCTNDE